MKHYFLKLNPPRKSFMQDMSEDEKKIMKAHVAYCGLDCSACPIHLATLEPDAGKKYVMRVEIAHECFVHYGMNLLPEEVNDCDGCQANTGRLFSSCRNCAIRKCASTKKLENCAFCEDYSCAELEVMFRSDPDARSRLEQFRTSWL